MTLMGKARLEAFSDAVLAIIITIMVLELHPPVDRGFSALGELLPHFLVYLLSFLYLAIYWNNHHHLLHAARGVDATMMWANLHLLFWLSLIPFGTAWLGKDHGGLPTAIYGFILLMAGAAYLLLQRIITQREPDESALVHAIGHDLKGKASLALYATGMALGLWRPWMGWLLYVLVAVAWLVPDRRLSGDVNA